MRLITISWKNLLSNPLTFLLNCLLISFGVGILTLLLISSTQFKDKLENNSKDIDLVVGAKGSPLQLILSSIYYIDFPTGNISLTDAQELARNPMVKRAVPLGLGDNYNGFRIVGTDTSFINLYDLSLAKGNYWSKEFEVTIGASVSSSLNLKVGDKFFGSHGLTSDQDEHKSHPYIVSGVLTLQGNVTDNLILTDLSSIWSMHDEGEESEHTSTANSEAFSHGEAAVESKDTGSKEITSLLIQYYSPMSVVLFPRFVNKSTNMQAASPALESARLFSIIGIGIDTLKWFAGFIMFIATVSVFVSVYNSLKERKYDLAVMRIMGASKEKIFLIIIMEGVLLTCIGSIAGILLGHFLLEVIGNSQGVTQTRLTGVYLMFDEIYLIITGICIGIVAAIIPAIQAYRSDIAKIISKN
ncbi:efflux ABC transporter, permease protein [Arcticibacter svalbardensis MN12-7]|uniref:Efflux ABC transporter, permease protein n=1 Tax=Arcticibacter svalbardensis MN12-7 TaxID=1150600 RepID=R9GMW0_9SPHI|nr:FtsX-like permease family protein [Arcticibacter svalbardensis]EOR93046.1 efflux ABC transporter, permease protein [Arcticibacter svalbardensis MN12-7]